MHRCEHNERISLFCLSEHCEWKQPAGCQRCIKKYHNHISNHRVISEEQLISMSHKLSLQQVSKANSRKIQQLVYSYFAALKIDLTSSLDLMCKTLINAIGSPYLSQNRLLTVYKRIKHKEYKRLQQKQLRRFFEMVSKLNVADISKQQTKMYKDQLRKSHKLINGLEGALTVYQGLFKQLNQNFQRQKSPFEILATLLKQTIENADISSNLLQFHQKQMEKNKAQRAQKQEKSNPNDTKKSKNQYDSMMSTQYSSRLASAAKQKIPKTPQVQKTLQTSKTPSNIKQEIFYDSNNHKFGVKDFCTLQKLQKSDSQQIKTKRPLSLDKRLGINLSIQIPINTQRKRPDYGFMQQLKNTQNDKVQRQKITFIQKHESILNELDGEGSMKKSEVLGMASSDRSSLRENEISVRKQQLIEMIRNQVGKGVELKIGNNNSVVVKPRIEQITTMEINHRKNNSNLFGDKCPLQQFKSQQKSPLSQQKTIQTPTNSLPRPIRPTTLKTPGQKHPVNQIPDVTQDLQKSSQGSLEVLKKIIPKKNMNAHPKLPIQQIEEKPKQLAQSRLIIVPTGSKFQLDQSVECDSPLLKKKVINYAKKGNTQSNTVKKDITQNHGARKDNKQKFAPNHVPKKQLVGYSSPTKQQKITKQQKPEIKQSEQKSLNLLIKSIHLHPKDAIPNLQSSLKQAPNNLSAAEYLSYLYLQQSRPKQALLTCNSILDRFEIITRENEELLINLQNNKAAALNMLGRYSEAIVLLQRCIKCKEKDTLLKNLGDAYYFGSNYEKAVFYYEKAVKLAPHFDEAYYNMAVCLYLQNNFHNAHQALVKALDTAPRNPDYLELKKNVEIKIAQATKF